MKGFSNCAKCNGSSFKVVTQEPAGSNYKLNFVQCAGCNAPIGVLDFYNTGNQLDDQKKAIGALSSRLSNIENLLDQIARHLKR